ncbi:M15 family metallopeptidase domain-containing protein [Lysinibacillus fusiformis]
MVKINEKRNNNMPRLSRAFITCTNSLSIAIPRVLKMHRSQARQNTLFAQGRTGPGPIVLVH